MNTKMKMRTLSLLLCFVMLVGLVPTTVFAAGTKLETPQNLKLQGTMLSWDAVDNADFYGVTLYHPNYVYSIGSWQTDGTNFNLYKYLKDGEIYGATVIACSNGSYQISAPAEIPLTACTNAGVPIYRDVNVVNGTSSNATAYPGMSVRLEAKPAPAGMVFDRWELSGGYISIGYSDTDTTIYVQAICDNDISARATYKYQENVTSAFTVQPQGGAALVGASFNVTYAMNFSPQGTVKVQVEGNTPGSFTDLQQGTIDSASIKEDSVVTKTFRIMASDGTRNIYSDEFVVSWEDGSRFISQPVGGTVGHNVDYVATYALNFTPFSCRVERYNDYLGQWSELSFASATEATISSYDFNTSSKYRIKAIIQGGGEVYSDEFTVTWSDAVSKFIQHPVSGTVGLDEDFSFTFAINFTPVSNIAIQKYNSGFDSWDTVGYCTSLTSGTISGFASETTNKYRLEAYENGNPIRSNEFTVTWEGTDYTVSFAANGGSGTMADVNNVSGEYTLPACGFTAPNGQRFKAWLVGGNEKAVGDKITVSANTVVTAIWENIPKYIVSYNANGGSGTMVGDMVEENGKFTLENCTYNAPEGYQFKAWAIGSVNGEQKQPGEQITITAETYIYAIWEAIPQYNVVITVGNGMSTSGNTNQTVYENTAITDVVYTAADGYYFPTNYSVAEQNGISVTRNSYTQITVSGTPTAAVNLTLADATAKTQETTPSASFTATGPDTGTLSGVTSGMKYSTDGGNSWTNINSNADINLTGLSACTISVVKTGDGNTTTDSNAQSITVTKAAAPTTVVGVACTTGSNDDGKLQNVTTAMEYKLSTANNWTDGTGSDITSLANGIYYVRVKASGTVLASDYQTVNVPAYSAVPTYGIDLDVNNTYSFDAVTVGYAAIVAKTVTVINTGNSATGALTVALSGSNANSFELNKTSIGDIAVSGSDTFTVVPKTGLSAGTYTATVTVSGGNSITVNFNVSFTVNAASPTYSIALSPSGTQTFTAATVGYGAQTAKTITVSNTGTGATGALTVALSGSNANSFELNKTSIGDIAVSGSDTFTVVPKTGLSAGTYTATVTVSGNNSITASFDVSFTVNPAGGSGGGGSGYTYYTIKATAGVNGSISPTGNVSVREGRDQTFTITPDKGYAVSNVKIDGKSIGAVKSYTFENVRRTHTIEVIFMKANGNPQTGVFVDVATGSYYEDAVDWAVENGITKGTDDTHFSPDGICTRAQAVTFLWRAAGSPEPETRAMPFADVPAGSYYYDAVLWAVENGITKGTSDTTFSPNMTCSRAQIVTFLWRSEKSPAAGTANPFADVKSTAYYADAVLWAVKEDITKGTTNTTFSPDADCTRAQIVTFLWRCKK